MTEPRIVEWGGGYASGYAGWVLARAGFSVTRFVTPEMRAESWLDEAKALEPGSDLLDVLRGADLLITDLPDLLESRVSRLLPRSRDLARLSIVTIGWPAAESDANDAIAALTGVAAAIGEPDGSGQSPPGRQLEALVGLHAAAAGLAAVVASERDGLGELVDVDPLQCIAGIIGVNVIQYANYGLRWFRDGRSAYRSGGPYPFRMLRAKDGWITTLARSKAEWAAFLDMLGSPEWANDQRFADQLEIALSHAEEVSRLIEGELSRFGVEELVALANEYRVPLAPVRTVEDAVADERLFVRDNGRVDPISPIAAVGDPAALPALVPSGDLGPHGPLSGLRVLDFGWVWAAPIASAWLADLGADVVKVESLDRLDIARRRGVEFPASGETIELPGYERAMVFNAANRNKRSVLLDLKDPVDRESFFELVAGAHVLVESFAAGVLERLDITPDQLHAVNPHLVVVSMGGAGGDGEFVSRSYAPILSAFAGIEGAVRDREGDPLGMPNWGGADASGGSWALFGVLVAVVRGEGGQHLKVSQLRGIVNTCAALYTEAARSHLIEETGYEAEEITAQHFAGTAPGVSGDLFRAVTVHSWHPGYGERTSFSSPWRFARTPVGVRVGAPLLGDTPIDQILREWSEKVEVK